MAHDVFISHSSKDKAIADAVCAALEASKIRCWIAPRDILPGEKWASAITKAIAESQLIVLIVSSRSNESEDVLNELLIARDAGVILLRGVAGSFRRGRVGGVRKIHRRPSVRPSGDGLEDAWHRWHRDCEAYQKPPRPAPSATDHPRNRLRS